jgi:hypothetical protein
MLPRHELRAVIAADEEAELQAAIESLRAGRGVALDDARALIDRIRK